MRFMLILFVFAFSLVMHTEALARVHRDTRQIQFSSMQSQINQVIGKSNAQVGVYIKSMNSGQVLYNLNGARAFSPASTMKIMTAEAALIFLGNNYRFATRIFSDQPNAAGGTLKGNVYIAQTGDPTLTYPAIKSLIKQLKDKGIYSIRGNVYLDHTAFDQTVFGQNWEPIDKQRCYGAPIGAGMVDKNCISFQITPGRRAGAAAEIKRSSQYFYPVIRNQVITRKNRRGHCALKINYDAINTISLNGCMPAGRYAWGVTYVINDLTEYNRALFKNAFQQAGIRVYGSVKFARIPPKKFLLAEHTSRPLHELVHIMLKKSDNIIASTLFKKIGQLYTGRTGSWQTGSMAVTDILNKHANLPRRGLRILDGSGLSRDNASSPEQFMHVLEYAYNHSIRDDFISSLPIAGVDGTLKHRSGHFGRRVYAKTGSMHGIMSLTGYAVNTRKQTLAFAIIFNGAKNKNWQFRQQQDRIMEIMTRS